MTKIVNRIRAAVADARASQPFGAWIPNNKVLSATLAGGLVAVARAIELVDLPAGWSEVVAAAIVGYVFPESPVASAQAVRRHGGAVLLEHQNPSYGVSVVPMAVRRGHDIP